MNSTTLGARDIRHYRQQLEVLVNRLALTAASLTVEATCPTGSEETAAVAPAREPAATSSEGDEEVAFSALQTEGQLLAEARAALTRLDEGKFGQCEQCGHSITRTRLDAVPYARRCIRCARTANAERA